MMNTTSTLDGMGYVLANAEYFRLSKAAELLECTPEDLLHLGINNKVEIIAPVLSEGIYEWTINPDSSGFPEIVEPVQQYFDASDRVILSWEDLSKIEAKGWTIPTYFYAPSKAKEVDELLLKFCGPKSFRGCEPFSTMTASWHESDKLISSVTFWPTKLLKPDSALIPIRKEHYNAAWFAEASSEMISDKTTIKNLFISNTEFDRLKNEQPRTGNYNFVEGQILKGPHGNVEINAKLRESILIAAIYCQNKWPDECEGAPALANTIELNRKIFWPDDEEPPLQRAGFMRLLNAAIKGKFRN